MNTQQDASYWKSEESTVRYTHIPPMLFDVERSFLLDAVDRLQKKTSDIRILDLGCGGGRTTIPLVRYGFQVLGMDIAPNLIQSLQNEIGEEKAKVGDASRLGGIADQSFDIVLFSHNSIDYLAPIERRRDAFREINRVLKSGGYFIFSTHIFNPIVFNRQTLKNISINFVRLGTLLFRSGYYDELIDGREVMTYSSSTKTFVEKELRECGLNTYRSSSLVDIESSEIMSFIKSFLSWERYYMAIKN